MHRCEEGWEYSAAKRQCSPYETAVQEHVHGINPIGAKCTRGRRGSTTLEITLSAIKHQAVTFVALAKVSRIGIHRCFDIKDSIRWSSSPNKNTRLKESMLTIYF